jgi:hypothetical protein
MATKSPTNKLKFSMWTATMKTEYTGSIDQGIQQVFFGLSTKERRDKVIEELQKINVKLSERELCPQ